jgi:hypothetical protein
MTMFGDRQVSLGNLLAALAALHGVRKEAAIARVVTKGGYKVSQQAVSNYLRGEKIPPAGFMVGFIKGLGLEGEEKRVLISAWMQKNPDIEELYRLL